MKETNVDTSEEIKVDSFARRGSLGLGHEFISEQHILYTLEKLQKDRSFIYSLEKESVATSINTLEIDLPPKFQTWIFDFHLRDSNIYDHAGPILIAILVILYPFCSLWTLNLEFLSLSVRLIFPLLCVVSYLLVFFVVSNLACAFISNSIYQTILNYMDIPIRLEQRKPVTAAELDRAIRKDMQIGISLEPVLRQTLKSIWDKMWCQKMKIAEIRPEFALQFLNVQNCLKTIETMKKPFLVCGFRYPRFKRHIKLNYISKHLYRLSLTCFLLSPLIWSHVGPQHQLWTYCPLHSLIVLLILVSILVRDSIYLMRRLELATRSYILNLAFEQLKHMEFPQILYPQHPQVQATFEIYLFQKYIKQILK